MKIEICKDMMGQPVYEGDLLAIVTASIGVAGDTGKGMGIWRAHNVAGSLPTIELIYQAAPCNRPVGTIAYLYLEEAALRYVKIQSKPEDPSLVYEDFLVLSPS